MKVKEESEKVGLKHNIQKPKIMASSPITSWQMEGKKSGSSDKYFFLGLQNHFGCWLQLWDENTLAPWKESSDKHRWHTKKQRHHFADKGLPSQSYGFSSSHVWMWELNHKESWVPKNWCFQTMALEKTLESPWDCKEIKPVNPTGNQPWIFFERTDAEDEAPIFWPPDAKSRFIRKDPDPGKYWRQEKKGRTEDKMVGWHHGLSGQEFEQAPGFEDGQGSLACCRS